MILTEITSDGILYQHHTIKDLTYLTNKLEVIYLCENLP